VVTSIATALTLMVAAIPRIIGFVIILAIGWFISGILAKAVAAILRVVKFNDLSERAGITKFVRNMGLQHDPAGVVADLGKWFVRLIVLVAAFDSLGLTAVSQVFNQLLLWLPQLAVALVVLIIAGLLANAAADLVRGSVAEAGLSNPDMFATITRIAIWTFGIIVAVNQIGIASTLVNTLFMGFVAFLVLALGLSFGLGGREVAGQILQSWYAKSQNAAPKMQRVADVAQRKVA
jgi:hypothetical protein